jgi:urease accessory protein
MSKPSLIALLHLASPALPIGGFSYSQGLEAAVQAEIIGNAESAQTWIEEGLREVLALNEVPVLAHLWRHWTDRDVPSVRRLNRWFLANRETFELRQETEQMGWSLAQLALSLDWNPDITLRDAIASIKPIAFPTAFAYAAIALRLALEPCLEAYLFLWVENQVAAVIKAVPLGQVAGQKILFAMHRHIPRLAESAAAIQFDDIGTFAPQLGLLSARHESQYSRLFRS